jgi:hypothetical protein
MRSLAARLPFGLIALGLFASIGGCKSRGAGAGPAVSAVVGAPARAPSSSSSSSSSSSAAAHDLVQSSSAAAHDLVQLPEGPSLAIQAGKGVGPIRLGATVATIERLMAAPCEVKTVEVCRYIRRAVEFHFDKNGVTDRIVVHRHERPAGLDARGVPQVYGFFNGGIPPGAGLGMIPKAVVEIIGPAQSSARVTEKNDFNTISRDTYPGGMVLEYDEYKNGKVMLGGVILTKPNG